MGFFAKQSGGLAVNVAVKVKWWVESNKVAVHEASRARVLPAAWGRPRQTEPWKQKARLSARLDWGGQDFTCHQSRASGQCW
jgi:hypothetical protein